MRIILLSDTHGDFFTAHEIVKRHLRDADCFIHLGDGFREWEDLRDLYPVSYTHLDVYKRQRLLYCYPERITDELLDVIASEPKAAKYLDIPCLLYTSRCV